MATGNVPYMEMDRAVFCNWCGKPSKRLYAYELTWSNLWICPACNADAQATMDQDIRKLLGGQQYLDH